jgi:hypothetical protein
VSKKRSSICARGTKLSISIVWVLGDLDGVELLI